MTTVDRPHDRQAEIDIHARVRAEWVEQASQVLLDHCRQELTVTTDDLWPRLLWPGNGRAMGTVMQRAIKAGWIVKWKRDDFLQTLDHADIQPVTTADGVVVGHQSPIVLYQSLLTRPRASTLTTACSATGTQPSRKVAP